MAIDLEDFKAHIGLTSSDQNDAAQGILDAADAAIANRVGPLSPEAATYTVASASTTVALPHTRIVAVSDPAGCTVNADAGVITLTAGFAAGQVITYTHGFSTLPGDLRLAVLELARHMWASTLRKGGNRAVESAAALGGYLLPAAVESLLAPHRSLGFA